MTIKVYPTKRYRLSGCFKSIGAGGLSKVYFGFASQDKAGRQYDCHMADHFVDRKTTLAQPLSLGDTVVYLTSVANYTTSSGALLGIYPFEDYPEYTYTRNIPRYNAINVGNNSLSLISAYTGPNVPIGTKVVQQAQNICNYVYSVLRGQSIPNT
jgi:hypothetical protein